MCPSGQFSLAFSTVSMRTRDNSEHRARNAEVSAMFSTTRVDFSICVDPILERSINILNINKQHSSLYSAKFPFPVSLFCQ